MGTGKTILLYDIAMQLSRRDPVCIFHFGTQRTEFQELDERLKRIDFIFCDRNGIPEVEREYAAIFVDEGHAMGKEAFSAILAYGRKWHAPVILSYDNVDCVSARERIGIGAPVIEAQEGFRGFRLTNRIRLNHELSAFLRSLFSMSVNYRREYPNVMVSFGRDREEAGHLIRTHEREGYMFIWDKSLGIDYDKSSADPPIEGVPEGFPGESLMRIESSLVTGKEFDKVVMVMDQTFYYDEKGSLRNTESDGDCGVSRIMNLFHGLSRAREKIAIVIVGNPKLMEQIYRILQK